MCDWVEVAAEVHCIIVPSCSHTRPSDPVNIHRWPGSDSTTLTVVPSHLDLYISKSSRSHITSGNPPVYMYGTYVAPRPCRLDDVHSIMHGRAGLLLTLTLSVHMFDKAKT